MCEVDGIELTVNLQLQSKHEAMNDPKRTLKRRVKQDRLRSTDGAIRLSEVVKKKRSSLMLELRVLVGRKNKRPEIMGVNGKTGREQ